MCTQHAPHWQHAVPGRWDASSADCARRLRGLFQGKPFLCAAGAELRILVDGQTIGYTLVDADSVTAPKGVSFHGVATNCKPGPHTVEARPHLVDTAIATGQRINRPIV